MTRTRAHSSDLSGTMLGKDYRVLEPIGTGGMAIVYLVEHQTLQKQFAAKVLSSELGANAEARARFTEEAHAASQLDHENIVTISDFGVTADHRPYFVMELLRGRTLDQRLDEGPMTLEEVVAVSVPVARALAHAHGEDIVHRDVKPENIFLVQRSQGRWGVKVVDFGIAKTRNDHQFARPGETLGTPMVMAPEMCLGEDVDQRADIYAFGVLLYLMLCGRVPFDDPDPQRVMQMHVSEPPLQPRLLNPELSVELEAVVLRALEKQREDRYPTMDALLMDLEAALPPDSDRMLIEAQSGNSLRTTPFPNTLSLATPISHRIARPSQPPLDRSDDHSTTVVVRVPPAARTRKRGGVVLAIGLVCVAAAGAVGFVLFQQSNQTRGVAAIAASPSPAADTPPLPQPRAPAQRANPQPAAAPLPDSKPVEAPPEVPAAVAAVAATDHSVVPRTAVRNVPKRIVKVMPPPPKSVALPSVVAETVPTEASPPPPPPAPPPPVIVAPLDENPPSHPEPTPMPKPAAPKPATGSLDATALIGSLDVKGSLPSSEARRSVERMLTAFRSCYRAAAKAQQTTPAVDVLLTFEIDENSIASHVAVGGANFGTLGSCVTNAASQIRTQQAPDVGSVHVTATIRFRPT